MNTAATSHDPNSSPKRPPEALTAVDFLVILLNAFKFFGRGRKGTNFRYANYLRDAISYIGEFSPRQFFKVYGRYTARHKYHPLQRFQNSIRRFDLSLSLATEMSSQGTQAFYSTVCGQTQKGFPADLTQLKDISTISSSGAYLYEDVAQKKGHEKAAVARHAYERAYSRVISVMSDGDWEDFRNEMRRSEHLGAEKVLDNSDQAMLVAVSYKGKEKTLTRDVSILEEVETQEGTKKEKPSRPMTELTKVEMSQDFVDDFRWSQLVRSCQAIAEKEGKSCVRLWIDRLVGMGLPKEKKDAIYDDVEWEDFGMFAYAVCPVVRLYDTAEPYYGTDFWRKLEIVMGVAGKGVVVDDYMIRKFDSTIFYGPDLYQRLGNGLAKIGGTGMYLRSVTLALATAIVTDGATTARVNEDRRTKRAVSHWKAWALRTIAEGAYSRQHSSVMMQEDTLKPFLMDLTGFFTIAFWESLVSRSPALTGNSYLDMSLQRSSEYRTSSRWDGIVEWIGNIPDSCEISKDARKSIMEFMTQQTELEMQVTTTSHVACIMTLRSPDMQDKRAIVVRLSRFSNSKSGHVTAVAEGTGLWGKKVLPAHLRHVIDPDIDQEAKIVNNDVEGVAVIFTYNPMRIEYWWARYAAIVGLIVAALIPLILVISLSFIAGYLVIVLLLWWFGMSWLFARNYTRWPWMDPYDVGEAVFDNLLQHSLFKSGVKSHYRRLETVQYDQIGWS